MSKKLLNLLLFVMMLAVLVPTTLAAPPAQEGGRDYVVVADDWLSKLADKYLGNPMAYPAIVEYTNQKRAEDDSYAEITDPDLIEVGWKIYIPSAEEAAQFVAEAPVAGPEPKGGDVVWAFSLEPSGIDPHVNASSELGTVAYCVYDFLTVVTSDFELHPGLAKSWDVSSDDKVYTFYLKEGVKFHDGTDLNAEAVKFNFDRILDPEMQSQTKSRLGPVESVEAVDEYTVKVQLSQPYGPFLASLADIPAAIASPTAIEKWGADYISNQVGSGPFMWGEYVPKDHIKLVVNPDYNWAPEVFGRQGPALLDSITFRFIPEPGTRLAVLQTGEVHGTAEILESYVLELEADPAFEIVYTYPPGMSMQYEINTTLAPTDDILVRQAILYAVDQEAIVDIVYSGVPGPAEGPLVATLYGHSDTVKNMYPYSPQKAEELLEQAGWTDSDGDGIRDKDGKPLVIQVANMNWGQLPEVGQVVQAQLREVGIDLQLEQLSYPAALQKGREGTVNMTSTGLGRQNGTILMDFFHSKNAESGYNWSKIRNAELDSILEEAYATDDWGEQTRLYQQAEDIIMENALVLPIQDYAFIYGLSSKLKDVTYYPAGRSNGFYNAYLEE
jgi:peptide/nickel transport system substrate-binding protein